MVRKCCLVPECPNTSVKTPSKIFVNVPVNAKIRRKWFQLSRLDPKDYLIGNYIHICEDHFDMEKDMENFRKYKMGFTTQVRMRNGVLPSKFECQKDHQNTSQTKAPQTAFIKGQNKNLISECEQTIQNTIKKCEKHKQEMQHMKSTPNLLERSTKAQTIKTVRILEKCSLGDLQSPKQLEEQAISRSSDTPSQSQDNCQQNVQYLASQQVVQTPQESDAPCAKLATVQAAHRQQAEYLASPAGSTAWQPSNKTRKFDLVKKSALEIQNNENNGNEIDKSTQTVESATKEIRETKRELERLKKLRKEKTIKTVRTLQKCSPDELQSVMFSTVRQVIHRSKTPLQSQGTCNQNLASQQTTQMPQSDAYAPCPTVLHSALAKLHRQHVKYLASRRVAKPPQHASQQAVETPTHSDGPVEKLTPLQLGLRALRQQQAAYLASRKAAKTSQQSDALCEHLSAPHRRQAEFLTLQKAGTTCAPSRRQNIYLIQEYEVGSQNAQENDKEINTKVELASTELNSEKRILKMTAVPISTDDPKETIQLNLEKLQSINLRKLEEDIVNIKQNEIKRLKHLQAKRTIGGEACCVVGCFSSRNKNPNLSFYRFPSKPWEAGRKKEWIESVNRKNADGTPWEPSRYSTICSTHFREGKKSEDPRRESYNPTIFPVDADDRMVSLEEALADHNYYAFEEGNKLSSENFEETEDNKNNIEVGETVLMDMNEDVKFNKEYYQRFVDKEFSEETYQIFHKRIEINNEGKGMIKQEPPDYEDERFILGV